MESALSSCKLVVKKSPLHGYGVFAGQKIKPGSTIEECYALVVEDQQNDLANYYFDHKGTRNILPLGCGVIYNHSPKPNASFEFDPERSVMAYRATRLIRRGEEIFISYGAEYFSSRDMEEKMPARSHALLDFILLWVRFALVAGILFIPILMRAFFQ